MGADVEKQELEREEFRNANTHEPLHDVNGHSLHSRLSRSCTRHEISLAESRYLLKDDQILRLQRHWPGIHLLHNHSFRFPCLYHCDDNEEGVVSLVVYFH